MAAKKTPTIPEFTIAEVDYAVRLFRLLSETEQDDKDADEVDALMSKAKGIVDKAMRLECARQDRPVVNRPGTLDDLRLERFAAAARAMRDAVRTRASLLGGGKATVEGCKVLGVEPAYYTNQVDLLVAEGNPSIRAELLWVAVHSSSEQHVRERLSAPPEALLNLEEESKRYLKDVRSRAKKKQRQVRELRESLGLVSGRENWPGNDDPLNSD